MTRIMFLIFRCNLQSFTSLRKKGKNITKDIVAANCTEQCHSLNTIRFR